MLCRQRKSHRTRTNQWNPSMMFSSITHNCIPAIVCSQHTRLVSSNRLCSYWSSHMFPITDLFASYPTHLVHLNNFCSHVSTQTVHPSESHVVYRTHLDLPNHKQFIRVNRMLYIAHTFIWLPVSFVPPHHKQFFEWTICCVSHTPSSGYPFLLFLLNANN